MFDYFFKAGQKISTMRRIRDCKIKGLYYMLLLFLALINKTWPCEETCVNAKDRKICYFEVCDSKVDWDTGWQLCNSRNSTLPVIRDRDEQEDFAKFLNVGLHMSGSAVAAVWTSGKNYTYDYWTWVDGRTYSDQDGLILTSTHRRHQPAFARATPFQDGLIIGDIVSPHQSYHYSCQYSGSLCSQFSDAFDIQNGCIRYSYDKRSWYDARNQCLITGGDLLVLEHDDRLILKDYFTPYEHWIGLRKTSWRWNLHQQASEEDEIKYTNWSDDWDPLTGNCISINASNGKWKAIGCSEKLKVVCQRDFVNATSSKLDSSGLSDSVEQDSRFVSYATFISVALGCICVIVISNIIVALVVRKYAYRTAQAASVREPIVNRCYIELETTRRQANADDTYTELPLQPVYDEVHENVYHLGY